MCRENVGGMLNGSFADKQQQKAMKDILERVHQLDMTDKPLEQADKAEQVPQTDELMHVSQDTLAIIINSNEDGDIDLSTIPAEDRRALEAALAASGPSDLLQPWQAWWSNPETFRIRLCQDGKGLVQELETSEGHSESPSDHAGGAEHLSTPPPPPTCPIPPFESLTSSPPSPHLPYALLQLIFAYCCALRLYNGDALADIESFIAFLWQLCPFVSTHTDGGSLPASLAEAVHGSVVLLRTLDVGLTHVCMESVAGLSSAVWADAAEICSAGCGAVVCALADLHRQHMACDQQLRKCRAKKKRKLTGRSQLGLKTLKLSKRKVEFYMSFAHAQTDAEYAELSQALQASVATMQQNTYMKQQPEDWKKMLLVNQKVSCNEM